MQVGEVPRRAGPRPSLIPAVFRRLWNKARFCVARRWYLSKISMISTRSGPHADMLEGLPHSSYFLPCVTEGFGLFRSGKKSDGPGQTIEEQPRLSGQTKEIRSVQIALSPVRLPRADSRLALSQTPAPQAREGNWGGILAQGASREKGAEGMGFTQPKSKSKTPVGFYSKEST